MFYMTEERELFVEAIREFVATEVKPVAKKFDETGEFPLELFHRCGEFGLTGLGVSEEYGGMNLDMVTYCLGIEEISKESSTLAMDLIAHQLVTTNIRDNGTLEQKKKWLTPLANGTSVGCYAQTEPCGLSNSLMWKTSAKKEGNEWVINGTKCFCTNIGVADFYLVTAIIGEPEPGAFWPNTMMFLVEKERPGFRVGNIEDKVGWHGSNTGTLYFENVRIPVENEMGHLSAATEFGEYIPCAACGLGIAETSFGMTMDFTISRPHASGMNYYDYHEVMRHRLVSMYRDIEGLRALTYMAADDVDHGKGDMCLANSIKCEGFKIAEKISSRGIQMMGGLGVVKGTGIERLWRDAKVGMVGGGEEDMMDEFASFSLLDSYKAKY